MIHNPKSKKWKGIIFIVFAAVLLFLLCSFIVSAVLYYPGSPSRHTHDVEDIGLFWADCFLSVFFAELLVFCILKLIHLFSKPPKTGPVLSNKRRRILFIATIVLLVILLIGLKLFGERMLRRLDDPAVEFSLDDVYYEFSLQHDPWIIGIELNLGFILWLIGDWIKEKKLRHFVKK